MGENKLKWLKEILLEVILLDKRFPLWKAVDAMPGICPFPHQLSLNPGVT